MLEGTDGSGKSTLGQQLLDHAQSRDIPSELWHRGVPQRHPLEEYELDLEQKYMPGPIPDAMPLAATELLLVLDRWHLGQLVYGGLYRDANDLGDGGAWHVNAKLESLGALQLILSPPLELIRERLRTRGEDYLKEEHVEHVRDAYEALAVRFARTIDVIREPLDDYDVRVLIDAAQARAQRAQPLAEFKSYVGPLHPSYLLFGDGAYSAKAGPHNSAFVPYEDTAGRWLCDTLASDCLFGRDADTSVGIASAMNEDVEKLIDITRPRQIVAMGSIAHNILERHNIQHGTTAHPNVLKTFAPDDRAAYCEALFIAGDRNTEVNPWRR